VPAPDIPKGVKDMDEKFPSLRGLINDLVRTITAAIVHMDDLLLNFDRNLEEFDDALLADEQLSMALEYLLELRSLYIFQIEYGNINKNQDNIIIQNKTNLLNNFLTAINLSTDFLLKYHDKTKHKKIVKNILDSINIIKPLFNEYYKEHATKFFKKYSLKIKKTDTIKKLRLNRKIMLVEDQHSLSNIINRVLTKHGYLVINCATGKEAVALFKAHDGNFFLLIVDVCLPDINGYDLCRQFILKKPDIKILFTSGYYRTIETKRINDFRDYSFLSKPFSLDNLLSIVDSIK